MYKIRNGIIKNLFVIVTSAVKKNIIIKDAAITDNETKFESITEIGIFTLGKNISFIKFA